MILSFVESRCVHLVTRTLVRVLVVALAPPAAVLNAQTATSTPPDSPWSFAANYSLKEFFDGNVYLQDMGGWSKRRSLVTSGTLGVALGYQRTPAFKAAFTYAPELVRFHSYASENYVTHRTSLNFNGVSGRTAWEFTNAFIGIDGGNQGPIFDVASKCDIPAVGGIPLRDRRAAVILRNGFKATHSMGRWFLRPVFSSYVHDFRTEQRPRTGPYLGYENYVDRYELSGGVDAGYRIGENTSVVLGHRYGHQEQGKLLGVRSPYSNSYNRVLFGFEGAPAAWMRLNVLAGPDIRRFERSPANFDADELRWFVNASLSWLPSTSDTVTLVHSRFQQPAFSSHSLYEDIVYDLAWRRQYTKRLSGTAGFRIYGGDWCAPASRDDWIYTPAASLSYTFHKRLTAEVAYSHDRARSRIPNTQGRDFTRNLFSVGVKGTL
jgi:hypothetical protein